MPRSFDDASADTVLASWRDELAALGGQDTLLHFQERPAGTLDLGHAHPSGVAGFLAGRPTRLSSLFREEESLAAARKRARAVSLAGSRLTDEHALPGTHLAVGMVQWPDPPYGPPGVMAPVLLRPIVLQPKGVGVSDHELDLRGAAWINPALVGLLSRYGVDLDPDMLGRLAMGPHGFTPRRVLERVAEQTAHLPGLRVVERIVVGTFIDLAPGLLTALDATAEELRRHPVVSALAASAEGDGAATAAWAAAGGAARTASASSPARSPFSHDWDTAPEPARMPVTVFPLDADQYEAVAVAARSDVCVLAPPGTGATQLAAQMVVQAAEAGERVLVVAPRRGELRQLVDRLAQRGLHHLTDDGSRLTRPPRPAPLGPLPEVADREWLHTVHEQWQVTPLHVLRVSAQEAERRESGTADPAEGLPDHRMSSTTLNRLVGVARQRAGEVLGEGMSSGAFSEKSRDTPWFGAVVSTGDEVRGALDTVDRLHDRTLPDLLDAMARIEEQVGIKPGLSLADWASTLDLLLSVETTVSVFRPAVYQVPLNDLIVATATPQWRTDHGYSVSMIDRRRFRRAARDLLQPGADPGDLHDALVRARDDARQWRRLGGDGEQPRLPDDLPRAESLLEAVADDLEHLRDVMANAPWLTDATELDQEPIDRLMARLRQLQDAAASLRSLPRQARLRTEAAELGLAELVDLLPDTREVPPRLADDLEVMWCAGVLRELLAERRDAAQASPPEDNRAAEIDWLTGQVEGGVRVATLATALAVPYRLGTAEGFDRVILLGAHRLGLAEAALSVVRGTRLAVIGDPAGARPAGLELGDADQNLVPLRRSVLDAAVAALPTVPLRFTQRAPAELIDASDEVLGAGSEVPLGATPRWRVPAPWTQRRLRLERVVDGRVAPTVPADDGPVEAPDTEVRRVVDLVMAHAQHAQEQGATGGRAESLAVVTLTRSHARRIAELLRLRLRQHPEVADWILRAGMESFVVTDIARVEDVTRDRIVLSVGLGLTPHGAMLHRFGPLDEPDGARLLRTALMRARQRITVVTCLEAADLDPERTVTPGAVGLRRLLELAAQDETERDRFHDAPVPDPLLGLLVAGLREAGAQVYVTVGDDWPPEPQARPDGGPCGFNLAPSLPDLVVYPPAADGGQRDGIAVIYDGRTAGIDPGVAVVRDARLAETLTGLGWSVVRVRAVDLLLARHRVVEQVLG